jgi:molybdopterin-containing oxidoreductase family iron-sulfur binding subunit
MRALLAVLALIGALSGFATQAQAEGNGLWPTVPAATGDPHPEGSEHWRKFHMNMMKHDRDATLRDGERDIQASLAQCFNCHEVKDEAGTPVTYEDERHFCRVCHDFAAVKVDCFMCHRSTADPDATMHATMATPDEHNSIAAYLARVEAEGGRMKLPSETNRAELTRRDILKSGAAVASVTLAPGVTLMAFGGSPAEAAAADAGKRWGLLIDAGKCAVDCDDCVTACKTENGWGAAKADDHGDGHDDGHGEDHGGPDTDAQWIRKVVLKEKSTGRTTSAPVMCQHCESPPCVDVCPTGASMQRVDGIVLVDKHICIGCRYCMMACPFKARSFVHEDTHDQRANAPRGKGTVESCTLCVHRVDKGRIPACVESCEKAGHSAILFGDLKDPESPISKALKEYPSIALRDDLGLNPGVRYQNL